MSRYTENSYALKSASFDPFELASVKRLPDTDSILEKIVLDKLYRLDGEANLYRPVGRATDISRPSYWNVSERDLCSELTEESFHTIYSAKNPTIVVLLPACRGGLEQIGVAARRLQTEEFGNQPGVNIVLALPHFEDIQVVSYGNGESRLKILHGALLDRAGRVRIGDFPIEVIGDLVHVLGSSPSIIAEVESLDIPVLSSFGSERWLKDKLNILDLAHEFQVPDVTLFTFSESNQADIESFLGSHKAEGIVIKPRDESLGKNVSIFLGDTSREGEQSFEKTIWLELNEKYREGEFLLQRYVQGIPMFSADGTSFAHAVRVVATQDGIAGITMRIGPEGTPVNGATGAQTVSFAADTFMKFQFPGHNLITTEEVHKLIGQAKELWEAKLPQVLREIGAGYAGFDFILTRSGPVLIEGNGFRSQGIRQLCEIERMPKLQVLALQGYVNQLRERGINLQRETSSSTIETEGALSSLRSHDSLLWMVAALQNGLDTSLRPNESKIIEQAVEFLASHGQWSERLDKKLACILPNKTDVSQQALYADLGLKDKSFIQLAQGFDEQSAGQHYMAREIVIRDNLLLGEFERASQLANEALVQFPQSLNFRWLASLATLAQEPNLQSLQARLQELLEWELYENGGLVESLTMVAERLWSYTSQKNQEAENNAVSSLRRHDGENDISSVLPFASGSFWRGFSDSDKFGLTRRRKA